jgi:hypothetical protein
MKSQDRLVQLVTRRELAERWSVSTETLKRRERFGVLPFLKLGKGVRYRLSDIEQLEGEAEIRQSPARKLNDSLKSKTSQ